MTDEAARLGVRLYDYFDSEELKIKNAYLTAEGAVSLAMNELDLAIAGSRTAVVGYGRIGKFLARMLASLDSSVTVAARKPTDLAYAAGFGLDTLKITSRDGRSSLCDLADCHVIFNTAPHWLFDSAVLPELSPDTLIIDLASAPGGVDPEAAGKYGIRVISALGLPGKYAPLTAGRYVGEAIVELIPKIT
jgi:dipicolinate synthase subunit A